MSKIPLVFLVCVLLGTPGGRSAPTNPQELTGLPEGKAEERSKSVFSTLQNFVHGLYQEFVNRRQSITNLLTCGNCVSEGWDAIMAAVENVPGLEWAYKPDADHQTNFFTALNQNGVVTGFGGSIIDNKPVVEFVFDHHGIVQHLNNTDPDGFKH